MIPTHVFVDRYNIQLWGKWIFHHKTFLLTIKTYQIESSHIQTGRIQLFACFQQRGKKFIPCFGRLRFIGNSPISDCTAILVTLYHFRQHPLRFLTGIVVRKVNTLPDRYLLPKDKAHLFCQSHRIFVLRIMCQPNRIHSHFQHQGCIFFMMLRT